MAACSLQMVYDAHMLILQISTSQAIYPQNNNKEKKKRPKWLQFLAVTSWESQFLTMHFRCHLRNEFESYQAFWYFFFHGDSIGRDLSTSLPLKKEGTILVWQMIEVKVGLTGRLEIFLSIAWNSWPNLFLSVLPSEKVSTGMHSNTNLCD